ncbi:cystathionine beta-lyase [Ophiocordyceps camponoti-floridani]|uniref:Cystathionine beta-lyase n=1 Tax=Ophiocordyceps camponoti-floridani TaxID=2030778 RepID=A0A8H4QBX9_9HYPO|nr:cystathionine beta-lyase [Ophiocordyceps camponoti-floridani]
MTSDDDDLSLASRAVHADDGIAAHRAVAPAMHVSTTFRYARDPERLDPDDVIDPAAPLDSHIYSRESAPNTARLEAVLASVLGGPTVTYASGLAAFHALLVRINPRRIAMTAGYHGCHGVVDIMSRLTGLRRLSLDCDVDELGPGDVIHVETPLNPVGEARNLAVYAERAREAGAYLTVDATLAPPPLQDPFAFGADVVMHSGTKYLGGHSDMLCGVLAVRPGLEWAADLRRDRAMLGAIMGSFEGWLGLRSVRTLELRVERQSATAEALVSWLSSQKRDPSSAAAAFVHSVHHASLQPEASRPDSWLRKQMPRGYGAVFAISMADEDSARRLPSRLRLFAHATSLGGVESLVEWRAMSDASVDRRLLRLSVGVEALEDLRDDLRQGLESLRGQ